MNDPNIPEFLKGNIPLQRRYMAALRTNKGCGSGCAKTALVRKFKQLSIQQASKKIVGRRPPR